MPPFDALKALHEGGVLRDNDPNKLPQGHKDALKKLNENDVKEIVRMIRKAEKIAQDRAFPVDTFASLRHV